MALTKQYRIEIQADAAGQVVVDLTKKLAQLDASLEGLDRDSDAAKAIVAEMAKVAQQIDAAEQSAERLAGQLDGIKPGTIPALEAEIGKLEEQLRQATMGTAEFEEAVHKLGGARAELKALEDRLDILADTKQHAAAFVDFANGVVGSMTIATNAMQVFGLSQETADQYAQKLLGLLSVMQSLEQISRAVNVETLGVMKSTWKAALAWLGFGASAEAAGAAATEAGAASVAASEAAAAGLTATGVGAILVAIGVALVAIIALWDKWTASASGSAGTWTKIKAITMGGLGAMWQAVKDYYKILWNLITFDFPEAWATAKSSGKRIAGAYVEGRQEVLNEARRKELASEVEHSERILKVMQAQGVETERFEREIQRKKVAALKQGSKEYAEAVAEFAAFNAAARRKHQQQAEAETLAHMNRLLAIEQAHGRSTYALQLEIEQQKLADLLAAPQRDRAAIEAQQGVITALKITHEKEINDRLFALRQAGLDGRIALEQQKGEDAYKIQIDRENKLLKQLQAAGTKDLAAIKAQQDKISLLTLTHDQELDERARQQQAYAYALNIADLEKQGRDTLELRLKYAELIFSLDKTGTEKEREQKRADYQALLALQIEYNARVREGLEQQQEQRADIAQDGRDADARFIAGTADYLHGVVLQSLAKKEFNLGASILTKLFGVKEEDVERIKAGLNQAFGEIANDLGEVVSTYFTAATQAVDAELQAVQDRLQQLDSKLSEASNKRQADEQALTTATGARRDYLLRKVEAERRAEAELAAEKKKAAAQEAQAQKEKAKLDKEQQQITAASNALEAVLLAIRAAERIVDIAGKGFTGYDNIALAIAAAATIATSIFTVKNAAKQFAAGGLIEGPRHAAGGVPFTVAGRAGFEAEGGEFIFSRAAVARHGVPFLQLLNDSANTYVKPHPTGHFAAGGRVPNLPAGMVAIAAGDLSALLDTNRAMLGYLQGIHGATEATEQHTQAIKSYGPAQLNIGPSEARGIREEERKADEAEGFATLGG